MTKNEASVPAVILRTSVRGVTDGVALASPHLCEVLTSRVGANKLPEATATLLLHEGIQLL